MPADRCGATRSVPGASGLVCDKAPGHDGDHRGYLDQQDEVLFWPRHPSRLILTSEEDLAGAVAAAAEIETIRRVADHWFTQGGAAEFGPLEHDGREPRNADELTAAILAVVRSRSSARA